MKKIVSILSLMAVTTFLHAQGTVQFNNLTANITTNMSISHFTAGTETGGTASGKTISTVNSFYYQLFIQPYTGSLNASATNIIGGGWEAATVFGTANYVTGTNKTSTGALVGVGGTAGVAVNNWALPTAANYTTSGRNYFMIAGWSAGLGTSWADVSGLLAGGFTGVTATGLNFFGVSSIGNAYAAGAFSLSAQSLFLANTATIVPAGVNMTLFQVQIPEPSTIVLAGLGGLALLMLRRRK
jgi:hypothetical protein